MKSKVGKQTAPFVVDIKIDSCQNQRRQLTVFQNDSRNQNPQLDIKQKAQCVIESKKAQGAAQGAARERVYDQKKTIKVSYSPLSNDAIPIWKLPPVPSPF